VEVNNQQVSNAPKETNKNSKAFMDTGARRRHSCGAVANRGVWYFKL
jgi:hypothetical protein